MQWSTLLPILLASFLPGTVDAGTTEWTNVGPEGGGAGIMAIDPQDPATVYAGTVVGLFKSKDGGTSWSNAGLTGWSVTSLVIDPHNAATLYAATVFTTDEDVDIIKIFKSLDEGATWNEAGSGLPAGCCTASLSIDPQDSRTLYAFGSNPWKLFKSTDGGESWALTSALPGNAGPGHQSVYFVAMAIDPQTPNTLYAAGQGADSAGRSIVAVFKSTDGGANWKEASSGLSAINGGYFVPGALAIDPKNPRTVYATTFSGVFKSTDGGASWRASNSGIPQFRASNVLACCSSGVVVDPQNSNTLYVPGSDYSNPVIFKSTNGGASWNALNSLLPRSGYTALIIDPQSTLYAVSRSGPFKSTDGGASWRAANSGLRAIPVSSVAINPHITAFIYAGNYLSLDAGKGWFALNYANWSGPVDALAIDPQTPSNVYAGSGGIECGGFPAAGVFKSPDGGISWMDTRAGITCVSAIVIDPQSPSTIYAGSRYNAGVYKSTDAGTSWIAVSSGLPRGPGGVSVSALAIDPRNTSTVYAGTGGGLFKSTDGGASWSAVNSGLTSLSVGSLAIDPQDTGTVYAGTYGGLFKSPDGGASWRNLSAASSTNVYAVAIDPQRPGTIYAGIETGVAQSTDGGESWTPIPGGPGRARLLVLDPQDPNRVYAGGPGGLFAISLGTEQ
jgi:photosystem II stability/assembly factor-like uncharacterized protein